MLHGARPGGAVSFTHLLKECAALVARWLIGWLAGCRFGLLARTRAIDGAKCVPVKRQSNTQASYIQRHYGGGQHELGDTKIMKSSASPWLKQSA